MLTTAENDSRIVRTWQELESLGLAEQSRGRYVYTDRACAIAERLPVRQHGPLSVLLEAESMQGPTIMARRGN